ncbi:MULTISPECIES: SGNH/GDSL hydrolase family protein [unclassified Blastococcus]
MTAPLPALVPRRIRAVAGVLAAVALLAGLTACAPAAAEQAAATPDASPAAAPREATGAAGTAPTDALASTSRPPKRVAPVLTSFAVVGDSITAGGAVIDGAVVAGGASWVPAADAATGLRLVDGWAVPGARTTDMLAGVPPMAADVLVVMAGTNDVMQVRPWEESAAALEGIVATAGARRVVVVAIAPNDVVTPARQQYDAALARLAAARGWTHVDPWGAADAGDGTWVPGASADGVHPEAAVAAEAGRRIGAALAALR